MTQKLKCHNCGNVTETEATVEFVCGVCGAVNVIPQIPEASDEPLGCLAPTGFEWKMPAGKIGNEILGYKYVTAQGSHLTRDEYIKSFGVDPEIALKYMRAHRGVKVG